MTGAELLDLWRQALTLLVTVAAPIVGVSLGVGLLTSLLQAATQLKDSTLSFVEMRGQKCPPDWNKK